MKLSARIRVSVRFSIVVAIFLHCSFITGLAQRLPPKIPRPGITFQKSHGYVKYGEQIYSAHATADGGYIAAGVQRINFPTAYVYKTSKDGTVLWDRCFNAFREGLPEGDSAVAYCIQQTTDSGYIVTGYLTRTPEPFIHPDINNKDIFLVKLNATGQIVWRQVFGGDYNDEGHAVRQTADGGFVVVGSCDGRIISSLSSFLTEESIVILKTTATGTKVWEKRLGDISDPNYQLYNRNCAYDVMETSDGYILAGRHYYRPLTGGWKDRSCIVKMLANGTLAWAKVLPDTAGSADTAFAIIRDPITNGNRIWIAGTTQRATRDVFITSYNPGVMSHNGRLFTDVLDGGAEDMAYGMTLNGGGLALAGATNSFQVNGDSYNALLITASDITAPMPFNKARQFHGRSNEGENRIDLFRSIDTTDPFTHDFVLGGGINSSAGMSYTPDPYLVVTPKIPMFGLSECHPCDGDTVHFSQDTSLSAFAYNWTPMVSNVEDVGWSTVDTTTPYTIDTICVSRTSNDFQERLDQYEEHGTTVLQTRDGGFIAGGYQINNDVTAPNYNGVILKTDRDGAREWSHLITPSFTGVTLGVPNMFIRSMTQLTSGDYVITGDLRYAMEYYDYLPDSNIFLIRVPSDSAIQPVWGKLFGEIAFNGGGEEASRCVRETPDHGLILAGYSNSGFGAYPGSSLVNGRFNMYVVKTDSSGSSAIPNGWQNVYGNSNYVSCYANCIEPIDTVGDGTIDGYVVAGYCKPLANGPYCALVAKLDLAGNLISNGNWPRTYSFGVGDLYGMSIKPIDADGDGARDDGFVLAGYCTTGSNNDFAVLRIANSGALVWSKRLSYNTGDKALAVQQNANGNFAVAGVTNLTTPINRMQQACLFDLSPSGTVVSWAIDLPGRLDNGGGGEIVADDDVADIGLADDGGYIATGSTLTYAPNNAHADLWLIKTACDGQICNAHDLTLSDAGVFSTQTVSLEQLAVHAEDAVRSRRDPYGALHDICRDLDSADTPRAAAGYHLDFGDQSDGVSSVDEATRPDNNISIYPIPLRHGALLNLEYLLSRDGSVDISVVDMRGVRIYSNHHTLAAGRLLLNVSTAGWTPGSYVITLRSGDRLISRIVNVTD